MHILIVDDNQFRHNKIRKDYPEDTFSHAYNYNDAKYLMDHHKFDIIFMDHDLGDYSGTFLDGKPGKELTGYDVVLYLTNFVDSSKWPKFLYSHSQNPVGAWDIKKLCNSVGIKCAVRPFKG